MEYTIGETAKRLGTTPSALRYYEKEGLLPFVKRTSSGKRVSTEEELEWLLIIGCLKKTGLSIKQIRDFIRLVQKGDTTIKERKNLFYKQREIIEKQIAELEANRSILDYKCWFYETAEKAGSIEALSRLGEKDIPGGLRSAYKKIKNGHL
ncbi:MerR family transcriptional regulator [Treponema parvum]|uniref:MerR family transcriptional regulator n=1 Tax=Treponema parvum TaxID=138851 RepID=A0A975F1V5_9SPIR|nr:MerR family transcriptional regulator [Treponema parvum]QTQ12564.1 MerR family transcriptional regulator [Treponema parvum]